MWTGNQSPSSRTQANVLPSFNSPTPTATRAWMAQKPIDDPRGRPMKLSRAAQLPLGTIYHQTEQSIHLSQYGTWTRSNKQLLENARHSSLIGLKSINTPTINELPKVREGDKNQSFVISTPVQQAWKESTSSETITRYRRPEQTTVSLEVKLPLEIPNPEDTDFIPSMQTENSYSKKLSSLAWRYQPAKRRCPLCSEPSVTILTNSPKEEAREGSWFEWFDPPSTSNGNRTVMRTSQFNGILGEQSCKSFWSAWNILCSPVIWVSPVIITGCVCVLANQRSNLDISPDFESSYYCIYLLALSVVLTIYRLFLAQHAWASAVRSCGKQLEMLRECCKLVTRNVHCGNHVQAMVAILVTYIHLCRRQLRMDTTISESKILQQVTCDYGYFESDKELKQDIQDTLAASGFLGSRLMLMQESIIQRLSNRSLVTNAENVSRALLETQRSFSESLTVRDLSSSQDTQVATLVRFSCIVACAAVVLDALANSERVLVTAAMFVVIFILLLLDRLSTWVANPFELSGFKSSSLPLEYYCEVIGDEAENLIKDALRMLREQADREGVSGRTSQRINTAYRKI